MAPNQRKTGRPRPGDVGAFLAERLVAVKRLDLPEALDALPLNPDEERAAARRTIDLINEVS
jgi:hypothetical protein